MASRRRGRYTDNTKAMPVVTKVPATTSRTSRYPKHSWHTYFRPFQIQPCAIAPVQAGDTIKHMRFESRVLTDPIKDQVTGWWSELFFFYVRFSDLDEYADAQARAITLEANLHGTPAGGYGAIPTAATTWTYHNGNGPDWLAACIKPIVLTYFRPEVGAWNDYLLDNVPGAGLVGTTWLDTLSNAADIPATDGKYSVATRNTDAGVYEYLFARWEQLRKAKLTTQDYQEFLVSQGVDVPDQMKEPRSDKRRPELLRFTRQFSYPANTVKEDGTGTVAAVSWVISERMDRPIFCDEPGFIVGVQVVRPKLYRANQAATGCSLLRDARTLCPATDEMAPQMSIVRYDDTDTKTAAGPITLTDASVTGWQADVAGLFVNGDQFVIGTNNMVTQLPDLVTLQHTYPPTADIDALFAGTAKQVKADGLLSLSITGRIALTTMPQAYTD